MPQPMPNEADRLAALALYQILDTPPEFAHDALTELAAQICNCPVALISLLDERRQWFKSKYGFPADFAECPREITVCNTTICSNDLLYVPDLTKDSRFKDLPIVIGEPYLRFLLWHAADQPGWLCPRHAVRGRFRGARAQPIAA